MFKSVLILALALLSGCVARAHPPLETAKMTDPSNASETQNCDMRLDFSDASEISTWRTVLDGVMGGRSTGVRFAEADHMVFKGIINTNGGGFSSIRRDVQPGDMAGADSLKLRVRQDGRDYKLTFRTTARWRGRTVSYQVAIPATPNGEWATVDISLAEMQTYFHGEPVPADPFDASDVRELGINIADGIDGPFQLDIAKLSCA